MVRELAGRLTALDPDAGAAVQVIAYFDKLVDAHAGVETIVRGAATLARCPVRFVDDELRIWVRVDADGRSQDGTASTDPGWPNVPVTPGGPPALWLERVGPAGGVEAMILERAAAAARASLERTRDRSATFHSDPAAIEAILDAAIPERIRLHAARRLGLRDSALARAIALSGGGARVEAVAASGISPVRDPGLRAAVGPALPVLRLPESWEAAMTAFRLTAEGTEHDPGPRVVHADRLGGLMVLAGVVGPGTEPIPDVRALHRAAAAAPWMLATLEAVAATTSLRAAANSLTVHHSTLQDRLDQAGPLLGWSVHEPEGRLRLQLALAIRRLQRHPDQP